MRSIFRAVVLVAGAVACACSARSAMALPARPAGSAALDVVVSGMQVAVTLRPVVDSVEVLRITLQNNTILPVTLRSLTVENRATSSSAYKDAVWQRVRLQADSKIVIDPIDPLLATSAVTPGPTFTATFTNGQAVFNNLSFNLPAGATQVLHVRSGAAALARDGDALDLRIPSDGIVLDSPASISGLPLDPAGTFPVDGMSSGQIGLVPVSTPTLAVGSLRNLALDVTLPANGYQSDVLQRLAVQNLATARVNDEIAAVEAWLDGGDGVFAPAGDTRLGALAFTGDRWQLSGLSVPVPLSGVRVFVSVDVADQAAAGRTVRLALPSLPDVGVGMASANDGPVDRVLANPTTQAIVVVNRVTLAARAQEPGPATPGAPSGLLLEVAATNTYAATKTLTAITVTNAGSGTGSPSEQDANLQAVHLRADSDGDGVPSTGDAVLGTAAFVGGRASFGGFTWDLPAGTTGRLFVTGDVALAAADGDVLAASVVGAGDLVFGDPTAISAVFPLGPGSAWTVDGMVAAQITRRAAPPGTLGPGGGPALALDVTVSRNGYRDDLLTGLTVVNLGTAVSGDLAELRLWRDGGDGVWGGDDQDLGALAPGAQDWISVPLAVPLGAAGARLFVTGIAAAAPADSVTVRLAVPTDGVVVQSGNDGPRDAAVANAEALLITNRALLASLDVTPDAVIVGQPVTVRMTVRNRAAETVNGVAPSALTSLGSGGVTLASGPLPGAVNLAAGAEQVFTWTYTATVAGNVRFSGAASGVGAGSGSPYASLPVNSDLLRIFDTAPRLPMTISTAMPLSVNRGQAGVVPLFVTLGTPGGGGSEVRVTGLRLRIVNGAGAGIVPADLLARVAVQVGGVTHLARTSLETSGSVVDLTLTAPILVGAAPVTAAIAIDVSATTLLPNFRLVFPDSTFFAAEEVATGAPVQVALQGQPYPVSTGLARVVEEATRLDVAAVPGPLRRANQGQTGATLATWQVRNPGITGVTSDVRVASFAVTLLDSLGNAVAVPAAAIERLQVWVGPQIFADQPVTASEDSVIDIVLSPLLSVPVNAPLDLRIRADVAPAAALGLFRLRLGDSTRFDARDPNSGTAVAVVYDTTPILGDSVILERPADALAVSGIARMPGTVAVGSVSVAALDAVLRHPGGSGTASLRLDSLVVRCVDEGRNPVAPGAFVERLHVIWKGVSVATLGDPPASGGVMGVGIPSLTLRPGELDTLHLRLDFEAGAPPGSIELMVHASGLVTTDANSRTAVLVTPESGFEFPILSGLARLAAPARTLIADLADRLPATLVDDGTEITAGDVVLRNDAGAGSGDVAVDRIVLRAGDAAGGARPVGAVARTVRLYRNGTLWAEGVPATADSTVLLAGTAVIVSPGSPVTLDLRFVPRSGALGAMRLGFTGADVGVIQPANPLLAIVVQPPSGQSFPRWTAVGNFHGASLEASYANFPNPFAAGREPTRFAYYLGAPARVSLRIWTPRGERVIALLDGVARGSGPHESDAWDGRNGRGDVVANGVYVAEIVVDFEDGRSERLLRKVAVVR